MNFRFTVVTGPVPGVTSLPTVPFLWLAFLAIFCMAGYSPVYAQEVSAGSAESSSEPSYPPGLDDPAIGLEELQLRLIPLTLDQLRPLASAWLGLASDATQAAVDKSLEVRALAEGPAQEALRGERLTLLRERGDVFERFQAVVTALEVKGADPAEVAELRTYVEAILSREASAMTLQEFTDSVLKWLASPKGGLQIAFRIAVIAGSLLTLFIVARVVRRWADRLFTRVPTLSKLLRGFLVMVVYWLTIAFGMMIVLAALGVNITPLFALLGGASFIIAFALQETLGNLASGLMIMINRPFDEGDFVQIAGLGGTVQHVSIVSTTIKTPDNQVIVIPNSKVWGDVITNVTASDTRRVDLVFGISYGDSIDHAAEVLKKVVAEHPLVLDDPAPIIRVSELADSSVNFIVRPWTETGDYWTVFWDLQRSVKEAFDKSGISIPFPQTDMHVHVSNATPEPVIPPQANSKTPTASQAGKIGIAEGDSNRPEEDG